MRSRLPLAISCCLCTAFAVGVMLARSQPPPSSRRTVALWTGTAPGATGSEAADRPTITLFRPPAGTAVPMAVVVLPGGGYGSVMTDHEGSRIAEWLNARGVFAAVVTYRVAPRYRHPTPLIDAQRAIRTVRARAAEFGIAPDRVGVWGFSAGGHLAATTGTQFDFGDPNAADPIDRVSSRPDFLILSYPVISLIEPYAHAGSRRNLLGDAPDRSLRERLSAERRVTAKTPSTFLFHTADDPVVPVENSLAFFAALRKAGVPAELHIYEHGPHGVGLATDDPALADWTVRLANWLKISGLSEERKAVQ
ncbi:MAG: alpha/beta hydrolase [Capsulimonadales bacterium]|nr:alpha/beta hydrolase [Capsulimonadales bacterium]